MKVLSAVLVSSRDWAWIPWSLRCPCLDVGRNCRSSLKMFLSKSAAISPNCLCGTSFSRDRFRKATRRFCIILSQDLFEECCTSLSVGRGGCCAESTLLRIFPWCAKVSSTIWRLFCVLSLVSATMPALMSSSPSSFCAITRDKISVGPWVFRITCATIAFAFPNLSLTAQPLLSHGSAIDHCILSKTEKGKWHASWSL